MGRVVRGLNKYFDCYIDLNIIITSCLSNKLKLFCMCRVINSLREICLNNLIIGFDKVGLDNLNFIHYYNNIYFK